MVKLNAIPYITIDCFYVTVDAYGKLKVEIALPIDIVNKIYSDNGYDIYTTKRSIVDIDWDAISSEKLHELFPELYKEAITLKDEYRDVFIALIKENNFKTPSEFEDAIKKKYGLKDISNNGKSELERQYNLWLALHRYSLLSYINQDKYTTIKMVNYLDRDNYYVLGGIAEYTGHIHYGSAYETATDCGNCDGANCDRCMKVLSDTELIISFGLKKLEEIFLAIGKTKEDAKEVYHSSESLYSTGITGDYLLIYPTISEVKEAHPEWDLK